MKRQGGFTLIELVVVIVILGILAVTAAPRFLNLQDDAKNAALEGLSGAMQGAAGIVYGKAAIEGVEASGASSVTMSGDDIKTVFGYPAASENGILLAIEKSDDFTVLQSGNDDPTDDTNATIDVGLTGYSDKCVQYRAATSSAVASAKVIDGVSGTSCGVQ